MPTFPLSKYFLQGSVNEIHQDNIRRTEMDAGPPKVRRRYTAKVRTFSGQLFLTNTEKKTLESFFSSDCADGAIPFTWVHPFDNTSASMRFVGAPQYQHVSGAYDQGDGGICLRASIVVEILPT